MTSVDSSIAFQEHGDQHHPHQQNDDEDGGGGGDDGHSSIDFELGQFAAGHAAGNNNDALSSTIDFGGDGDGDGVQTPRTDVSSSIAFDVRQSEVNPARAAATAGGVDESTDFHFEQEEEEQQQPTETSHHTIEFNVEDSADNRRYDAVLVEGHDDGEHHEVVETSEDVQFHPDHHSDRAAAMDDHDVDHDDDLSAPEAHSDAAAAAVTTDAEAAAQQYQQQQQQAVAAAAAAIDAARAMEENPPPVALSTRAAALALTPRGAGTPASPRTRSPRLGSRAAGPRRQFNDANLIVVSTDTTLPGDLWRDILVYSRDTVDRTIVHETAQALNIDGQYLRVTALTADDDGLHAHLSTLVDPDVLHPARAENCINTCPYPETMRLHEMRLDMARRAAEGGEEAYGLAAAGAPPRRAASSDEDSESESDGPDAPTTTTAKAAPAPRKSKAAAAAPAHAASAPTRKATAAPARNKAPVAAAAPAKRKAAVAATAAPAKKGPARKKKPATAAAATSPSAKKKQQHKKNKKAAHARKAAPTRAAASTPAPAHTQSSRLPSKSVQRACRSTAASQRAATERSEVRASHTFRALPTSLAVPRSFTPRTPRPGAEQRPWLASQYAQPLAIEDAEEVRDGSPSDGRRSVTDSHVGRQTTASPAPSTGGMGAPATVRGASLAYSASLPPQRVQRGVVPTTPRNVRPVMHAGGARSPPGAATPAVSRRSHSPNRAARQHTAQVQEQQQHEAEACRSSADSSEDDNDGYPAERHHQHQPWGVEAAAGNYNINYELKCLGGPVSGGQSSQDGDADPVPADAPNPFV